MTLRKNRYLINISSIALVDYYLLFFIVRAAENNPSNDGTKLNYRATISWLNSSFIFS